MQRIIPYDALLIPKDAKLVFKGEIFSVYQWPQLMFDDTTATFEMLKRPDTMIVVALKGDKVVLLHEIEPGYPSMFHFPGGRVDPGDLSWLDTAKRETTEEAGLLFRNWRLIDVSQPATKIEWFVAWYIATDCYEERLQSLDSGEKIEVINEPIDHAVRRVLSTNKIEAKYIPEVILNAKSAKDLLEIPEFIGDIIEDQ